MSIRSASHIRFGQLAGYAGFIIGPKTIHYLGMVSWMAALGTFLAAVLVVTNPAILDAIAPLFQEP